MTGALKDFLRSQPVKRSEAAERPQLNPRPPDAEPARSAGGADAVGWKGAGASTPCDSLGNRVAGLLARPYPKLVECID